MSIALGIALILLLTAATGYFVAQEFAYVAVDRNALRRLADDGDPAAQRALRVTSQLSFTLSAAQFGITVTALLVGYISEPLVGVGLAELLDPSMSYAARLSLSVTAVLVFSTVVQMVFGELAPKNLAIARTVPVARALSRSTLVYLTVAGPVVRLFDRASTRLLRSVGIEPVEELEHGATAEDLTRIIDESHAGGLLDDDLSEVLEGGLRLRELDAADVMTPRVRVTTVRGTEPVSTLLELLDTGWSRFPVTGRDGDDIIGVAGIAELLSVAPEARATTPLRAVVSPPTVVPTSAPLPRVLDQIRADHRQLAVVVDEHGGFAGIVTFEDIAEEVVGEIHDEDDAVEPGIVDDDAGGWVLPGHTRLDEIETAIGLRLTSDDEYTTVSGLILEQLGRTATPGDVVEATARRESMGGPAHARTAGAGAPTGGAHDVRHDGHDGRGEAPGTPDAGEVREEADSADSGSGEVTVRLTVETVARHVPGSVRLTVLDLMSALELLDSGSVVASRSTSDSRAHSGSPSGAHTTEEAAR